jgi:hypothetical protein
VDEIPPPMGCVVDVVHVTDTVRSGPILMLRLVSLVI